MPVAVASRSPHKIDMSEISPPRRFLPQPGESTTKTHRRFPIEPIETSTKSSKSRDEKKSSETMARPDLPPKRRFLPELVESTIKSNRISPVRPTPELTPEPSPRSPTAELGQTTPRPEWKPTRRFPPQHIETIKRSKKAGDTMPATLPTDKTDITPGTNHIYNIPRRQPQPQPQPQTYPEPVPFVPDNTPSSSLPHIPYIPQLPPRRQGSMKPHLNTRRSTRQTSFHPELDAILADENENSDEATKDEYGYEDEGPPSLSASFGSSENSVMRLQRARNRESCDDRFSGYLLELAAKAAEKQLREQALAAFPNSDYHDPVEHFYDREIDTSSDDEDTIGVGLLPHERLGGSVRRKSTEVGWAAREMQQHQEHLARLREEETLRLLAAEAAKPTFNDPFWTNGMTVKNGPVVDPEKEAELERMRSAASPPMLGSDLLFRRCPSPKATKFETDQRANVTHKRDEDGGGLWGGYCVREDSIQVRGPRWLATPANEREDMFSSSFTNEISGRSRPSSPIPGKEGLHLLSGLDERLQEEAVRSKVGEALEKEFDDKFVTQVYNYLSLGYPSLARQYDEELSKISRISEEELCKDDNQNDVKGHIGLVEGDTIAAPGVRCKRWTALRIYILEWARQHPSMSNETASHSAWGVRARRGSWAI